MKGKEKDEKGFWRKVPIIGAYLEAEDEESRIMIDFEKRVENRAREIAEDEFSNKNLAKSLLGLKKPVATAENQAGQKKMTLVERLNNWYNPFKRFSKSNKFAAVAAVNIASILTGVATSYSATGDPFAGVIGGIGGLALGMSSSYLLFNLGKESPKDVVRAPKKNLEGEVNGEKFWKGLRKELHWLYDRNAINRSILMVMGTSVSMSIGLMVGHNLAVDYVVGMPNWISNITMIASWAAGAAVGFTLPAAAILTGKKVYQFVDKLPIFGPEPLMGPHLPSAYLQSESKPEKKAKKKRVAPHPLDPMGLNEYHRTNNIHIDKRALERPQPPTIDPMGLSDYHEKLDAYNKELRKSEHANAGEAEDGKPALPDAPDSSQHGKMSGAKKAIIAPIIAGALMLGALPFVGTNRLGFGPDEYVETSVVGTKTYVDKDRDGYIDNMIVKYNNGEVVNDSSWNGHHIDEFRNPEKHMKSPEKYAKQAASMPRTGFVGPRPKAFVSIKSEFGLQTLVDIDGDGLVDRVDFIDKAGTPYDDLVSGPLIGQPMNELKARNDPRELYLQYLQSQGMDLDKDGDIVPFDSSK